MTAFPEYESHDALGLAELVRTGEVTPLELVDAAIERIEQRNRRLNAVIRKRYERARDAAGGELPDGPFRGVPFLTKDLLSSLAGEPLGHGCKAYDGWRAPQNSELVNRYLASGVIIVGQTNTPELGLQPTTEPINRGPARNPWDNSRTTGGSSGGSAAAIASGMVPMAGGGDGGGSIHIPSSCCGLFGLKPTRGRTPTGPANTENWDGFAIEHVLTRSVRDSAAMLDAVCGWNPGDWAYMPKPERRFLDACNGDPGKLRIAVDTSPILPATVEPEVAGAVQEVAGFLAELGHEVVDNAPTVDGRAFAQAFLTVISGQTAVELRTIERRTGKKPGPGDVEVKTMLAAAAGNAFSAADYVDAVALLQSEAAKVHRFMAESNIDVILNPTVSKVPPTLGFLDSPGLQARAERLLSRLPVGKLLTVPALIGMMASTTYDFIPWTPVYNVTGQPSMSVPLSWSTGGLPIGSMFTGRYGDDATLLSLASQLEQARPWSAQRPPL